MSATGWGNNRAPATRGNNGAPTAEVNPIGTRSRSDSTQRCIGLQNTQSKHRRFIRVPLDFLQPYGAVSFLSFQLTASGG